MFFNGWDKIFINKKKLIDYPRDNRIVVEQNKFSRDLILHELYFIQSTISDVNRGDLLQEVNYPFIITRTNLKLLINKGWIIDNKGWLSLSSDAMEYVENNLLNSGIPNDKLQAEDIILTKQNIKTMPTINGRSAAVEQNLPAVEEKDNKYDVALSCAGENRNYVRHVAEYLKSNGIKVFYDEFEQVKMWGKKGSEFFHRIFSKESKFCVMFISVHYATKAWPTHEKRSALEKAINEFDSEYILPYRFDDTEVPGLTSDTIYLEKMTPVQLGKLIIEKVKPSK